MTIPSAADDSPTICAAVVGGPAFVRHLVLHVLHDAGLATTTREPSVTVLIEASRGCFAEARALGAPIVVLTPDVLDPASVVDSVARGADAVVHTDVEPGRLIDVLTSVMRGDVVLEAAAVRAVVEALREIMSATLEARVELSRREREILESIDRGESVKQTSRALAISSKTVENLQSRLFRKLGVRNRAQAVAVAHELGILAPAETDAGGG